MKPNTDILLSGLILWLFAFFLFQIYWRRFSIVGIFKHGTPVDTSAINKRLEELNQESTHYTFSCRKAKSYTIRGREVELADGITFSVLFTTEGMGGNEVRRPFVVVANRDVCWYRMESDIFEEAFKGSQYTVYWTDPVKVRALLHKRQAVLDAGN